MVLLAGSMNTNELAVAQGVRYFGFIPGWYGLLMPFAFIDFFVAALAEGERAPFDLLEADSEIVAGFNIEYSGMKFAMFFLGEWIHAFTFCAVTATLFFGGWRGPWVDQVPVLGVLYFFIKMFVIYFIHIWIRTTMPRMRIDHMLSFNWKFLVPLSLVNLIVMALAIKAVGGLPGAGASLGELLSRGGILFLVNMAMAVGTLLVLGAQARRERARETTSTTLEAVTAGVQR